MSIQGDEGVAWFSLFSLKDGVDSIHSRLYAKNQASTYSCRKPSASCLFGTDMSRCIANADGTNARVLVKGNGAASYGWFNAC